MKKPLQTLGRYGGGFLIAWLTYSAATTYVFVKSDVGAAFGSDSPLVMFISFGALLCAGFVLAAWLVGLPLRIDRMRRIWENLRRLRWLMTAAALAVIAWDACRTLKAATTGNNVELCPLWLWPAYVLAIFPIVNWRCRPTANRDVT